MAIRVLIVDDSSFFRRRISEIVSKDPAMEVVGMASNGRDAIKMTEELKPDVITMDVEMPIMSGIDAVRKIMEVLPTPILMFSSLTIEGASHTFNALEAGALDFITKDFDEIARDRDNAMDIIRNRIKEIARQKYKLPSKYSSSAKTHTTSVTGPHTSFISHTSSSRTNTVITSTPFSTRSSSSNSGIRPSAFDTRSRLSSSTTSYSSRTFGSESTGSYHVFSNASNSATLHSSDKKQGSNILEVTSAVNLKPSGKKYEILAIGASTGGPMALQEVLTSLPANLPVPIVVVQHMPATFTATFAMRLDKICKIKVSEAKEGEFLEPGHAYIAPGGMQMLLEGRSPRVKTRIFSSDPSMNYKPCVDHTFSSVKISYGGNVLGVIMTGMGSDGKEGCAKLKKCGATIWAQNEATCTIYGMPQAIVNAGIADLTIPLQEIGKCITKEIIGH